VNLNIRNGPLFTGLSFTLLSVEGYHFFIISREMSEYVNSIYYHSCFFLWIVSLRGSWSGSCSSVMAMFELAWVTLSTEWALLHNDKKVSCHKTANFAKRLLSMHLKESVYRNY